MRQMMYRKSGSDPGLVFAYAKTRSGSDPDFIQIKTVVVITRTKA
jgi:hypothetical protein